MDLTRTDTPYNMEDKTDSLSMALTQSVIKCISGFYPAGIRSVDDETWPQSTKEWASLGYTLSFKEVESVLDHEKRNHM